MTRPDGGDGQFSATWLPWLSRIRELLRSKGADIAALCLGNVLCTEHSDCNSHLLCNRPCRRSMETSLRSVTAGQVII